MLKKLPKRNISLNKTKTWDEMEIGDFVESDDSYLFCFIKEGNTPCCLGRRKRQVHTGYSAMWNMSGLREVRMIRPNAAFVRLCRKLLNYNYKKKFIKNLDYIEAYTALKRHGI